MYGETDCNFFSSFSCFDKAADELVFQSNQTIFISLEIVKQKIPMDYLNYRCANKP